MIAKLLQYRLKKLIRKLANFISYLSKIFLELKNAKFKKATKWNFLLINILFVLKKNYLC